MVEVELVTLKVNLTGSGIVPEVTFAESVMVGRIFDSVFGKVWVMVSSCVEGFSVTYDG